MCNFVATKDQARSLYENNPHHHLQIMGDLLRKLAPQFLDVTIGLSYLCLDDALLFTVKEYQLNMPSKLQTMDKLIHELSHYAKNNSYN